MRYFNRLVSLLQLRRGKIPWEVTNPAKRCRGVAITKKRPNGAAYVRPSSLRLFQESGMHSPVRKNTAAVENVHLRTISHRWRLVRKLRMAASCKDLGRRRAQLCRPDECKIDQRNDKWSLWRTLVRVKRSGPANEACKQLRNCQRWLCNMPLLGNWSTDTSLVLVPADLIQTLASTENLHDIRHHWYPQNLSQQKRTLHWKLASRGAATFEYLPQETDKNYSEFSWKKAWSIGWKPSPLHRNWSIKGSSKSLNQTTTNTQNWNGKRKALWYHSQGRDEWAKNFVTRLHGAVRRLNFPPEWRITLVLEATAA